MERKHKLKIILLGSSDISTRFIYNGLKSEINISQVLLVAPLSKVTIIKKRIKKLGLIKVINQLCFQILVVKVMKLLSSKKYDHKKKELNLNDIPIPQNKIIEVGNVNSNKTKQLIQEIDPDVIIVNGTPIISPIILDCTKSLFINTHVGITPKYRGVHGGYWALRNGDKQNFGVTIHLVDKGIDTGGVLYQTTTNVSKDDNFITYPLYQYALAIPLLKKTLMDIKSNKLTITDPISNESKLHYHPTFTEYLSGLIFKGVR